MKSLHYQTSPLFRMVRIVFLIAAGLTFSNLSKAQDSVHISLEQAIKMGIDSSKQLRLSEAKIQEALTRQEQALDKKLPAIKASLMGSQAFIPTRTLQIKGVMKEPIQLPASSRLYLGTLSINETIFAGNKLRYAEESASLMKKISELNAAHDKKGVIFNIIQSYINLYKIDENLKIVAQNTQDIQGRLDETIQFKDQGLATTNDVLRFKLQKANVKLTQIDLQNNREVANYAMTILLGLSDNTLIKVDSINLISQSLPGVKHFIQQAMQSRQDMKVYHYQNKLNKVQIENLKADKLPVLGAGITTYYLNPNSAFFPPANSFLIPITVGLNLSWNISSLYTTKHQVNEAKVKQQEIQVSKSSATDHIRLEINKNYRAYQQALQRIDVLQTAVAQAKENDRIMELKYRNQLANTTDRIDAQTMLYQSLINLELAKADAAVAWYELLTAAGTIQ